MAKKCYHPSVDQFTNNKKCQTAHIRKDGTVICMLGNIAWKIKNNKMGFRCDWEKPNH